LTRHQLDELDALLQKMLNLPVLPPVHAGAPETTGTPDAASVERTAEIPGPRQLSADPEPESLSSVAPTSESAASVGPNFGCGGENALPTVGPVTQTRADDPDDVFSPSCAPHTSEPVPPLEGRSREPTVPLEIPPPPARIAQVERITHGHLIRFPVPWRLLVAVNQLFDAFTYPLGPPGRWLRGPSGRACVGWAGVTLLVVAAAWTLLEWLAWIW
jgi:hypothetical protein